MVKKSLKNLRLSQFKESSLYGPNSSGKASVLTKIFIKMIIFASRWSTTLTDYFPTFLQVRIEIKPVPGGGGGVEQVEDPDLDPEEEELRNLIKNKFKVRQKLIDISKNFPDSEVYFFEC